MNFKLISPILTFFCCLVYAYQWYLGQPVPAYQPLIWCIAVFLHDVHTYIEDKLYAQG